MIYNLDHVLITPSVLTNWRKHCVSEVRVLLIMYPDLRGDQIPDEQLEAFPDGSAEIFVHIRGHRISMQIGANEWVPQN